jgi:hypothetical protein
MAVVQSLTEAEAGALVAAKGRKVIRHGSRQWEQVKPGFYQPVHVLGCLAESDASRPTVTCWGYRGVVPPGTDTDSRLVVYLIDDLSGYDMGALTRNRRNTLRQVRRSAVRLVALEDDALLRRQGHEVCLSAYTRFGFETLPTSQQYRRWLAAQRIGLRTSGVAAFLDGRLIGYILAHVIEGTAYAEEFHVATEALRTNVSTALAYELVQLLRESGLVTSVWNGNVSRDDDGIGGFKLSMGYARTPFPTRVHLWPGTGALLRRYRPHRYERLTGRFDA